MDDKSVGLYDKYLVYKHEGNPESPDGGWVAVEDWVFVLSPSTDHGAAFALNAYAIWAKQHGFSQLSDDIRAKIGMKPYEPVPEYDS